MNHLDIFSGIGGFSIAAERCGFKTIAFAETNPDASLILDKRWPGVRNFGDVRNVGGLEVPIHLLTGGVPCQPASKIGKMRGTSDERWLWPEAIRIVREFRPWFCVFENPPAITALEGGTAFNGIISGLVALRYDLWWEIVPAAAIGAGHLRERIFIIATNTDGRAHRQRGEPGQKSGALSDREAKQVGAISRAAPGPDADGAGLEGHERNEFGGAGGEASRRPATSSNLPQIDLSDPLWFETQSPVCPLVDGLPGGLVEAALRCVGNAVVPQVAEIFIREIAKVIHEHHLLQPEASS